MKKLMCCLMALLVALSSAALGGCTGGGEQSEKSQESSSQEAQGAAAEPSLEPITITVRNVYAGTNVETKGTPVGDIIFEKTGVNMKLEYSVGDENQTIALMIASGDLPDMVIPHYNVAPFVEARCAMELTDLIEEHAPRYKEALGTAWDRMVWSKEDQGRYYLTAPEQYPEPLDYFNWFFLQHAVVQELGYPKMETLEDYENAIRTYVEKYPTIDGQPTIGMTLLCDSWRWMLSLTNPAMMAAGTQSSGEYYVDPETRKVEYRILREEEKDYFRWLNHMYNEGLLDKEAFTQTEDQYKAKIATGRVLALTDMGWAFADATQALRQDGKEERLYGAYPLVLKEGIVNTSMCGERALLTPGLDSLITTSCEHPERILQLIDYYVTDEGQILGNWGIEGVHYDIVDGKRVFRKEEMEKRTVDTEYSAKTGIGLFNFLPGYTDGVKDATGQYYTVSDKESILAEYTETDKEVLEAYGKETWADFFPKPTDFPIRPWPGEGALVNNLPADSDGAVAFQKVQDAVKKGVINAIVSKPEEFDTAWDQLKKEMENAGLSTFTSAMEDLMQEQLEIWGME